MIAMNVVISTIPLARANWLGCIISGKMPYFPGPKNALCVPIKNSTIHSPAKPMLGASRKANKPSPITAISAALLSTITRRLL